MSAQLDSGLGLGNQAIALLPILKVTIRKDRRYSLYHLLCPLPLGGFIHGRPQHVLHQTMNSQSLSLGVAAY